MKMIQGVLDVNPGNICLGDICPGNICTGDICPWNQFGVFGQWIFIFLIWGVKGYIEDIFEECLPPFFNFSSSFENAFLNF